MTTPAQQTDSLPAGIYRDAWGIPHLRANSTDHLAYLQGWNAGIDRSWQIELERWRAEGRTAEHLGQDGVEWDRFAAAHSLKTPPVNASKSSTAKHSFGADVMWTASTTHWRRGTEAGGSSSSRKLHRRPGTLGLHWASSWSGTFSSQRSRTSCSVPMLPGRWELRQWNSSASKLRCGLAATPGPSTAPAPLQDLR